jgi:hypothetical protein
MASVTISPFLDPNNVPPTFTAIGTVSPNNTSVVGFITNDDNGNRYPLTGTVAGQTSGGTWSMSFNITGDDVTRMLGACTLTVDTVAEDPPAEATRGFTLVSS